MKTKITVLLFFAFGYALSQVGINTETPLSMLDINGNLSLKVVTLPETLPDNSTQDIEDGIYINIRPQFTDHIFRLPDPTSVPGRIYILRNIQNSITAQLTTSAGLLFPKGSTTGSSEVYMYENTNRTLIVISDGNNWTYFN